MLSRLLTTGTRCGLGLRARQSVRCVSLSAHLLGGGGHHHVDVPEPHIPKPQQKYETNWLGRKIVPRLSHDKHEHSTDDYASYFGGVVFVLLTVAAVAFYTDVFDMNIKKDWQHKHHRTYSQPKKETDIEQEAADEAQLQQPADVPKVTAEQDEAAASALMTAVEEQVEGMKEAASHVVEELPSFVPYLIVGSGAAAYYCCLAIRARDADAKVMMIGEEKELPYNKPPLSKELWWYGGEKSRENLEYTGLNGKKRDVFFEAQGFFVPTNDLATTTHGGVSIVNGVRVLRLDADTQTAHLEDGREVRYGKCLLATGGRPRRLPELKSCDDSGRVLYLSKVADYRLLDEVASSGGAITVVGGGFLGSELAYSVKRRYPETRVIQVIPESGPLSSVLPSFLSQHATRGLRSAGVEVKVDTKVENAKQKECGKLILSLSDGSTIATDHVVVSAGIEPDVSLANHATLKVDTAVGGFEADSRLRVGNNEWCAGDACAYNAGVLGRRRVEHWENAQITGRLAGENMTGGEKDYWYQPSFFTKIGPELHINAVGRTDSSLRTVSVFAQQAADFPNKYHKGVVFYTENQKIVGCLLVNVFGAGLDVGRRLIDEGIEIGEAKELAKLFSLWEVEKAEESEKNGEEKRPE